MVFFDTCVWMELLAVRTPVTSTDVAQALAASQILTQVLADHEQIVSCKEQFVEIIKTVEKVKLKEINGKRRQAEKPTIAKLKDLRFAEEFTAVQDFYLSILDDIKCLAEIRTLDEWKMEEILTRLHLADINDCLYYDYCDKNSIDLYTFDRDLQRLGEKPFLHLLLHG